MLWNLNSHVAEAMQQCCGGYTAMLRRLYSNVAEAPHSLDQFPTQTLSPEKESDGGSNTLMSCVNVVKRHVEINLIECQNIELNKLFEMVREHNLTTYRFNM